MLDTTKFHATQTGSDEQLASPVTFPSTYKGGKVLIHSSVKSETSQVFWLAPQLTEKKPNKTNHNKNPTSNLIDTGSVLSYLIIPEFGSLSLQKDNPNT